MNLFNHMSKTCISFAYNMDSIVTALVFNNTTQAIPVQIHTTPVEGITLISHTGIQIL